MSTPAAIQWQERRLGRTILRTYRDTRDLYDVIPNERQPRMGPKEDLELHLSPVDDFAPATRAHPGVLVNDLDLLSRQLETAGRPVRWDTNFPGFRRFHSADDHGNRLEFMQATD